MSTPFLYDEGEEAWPTKCHYGCGGVYLDGYSNVDIDGFTYLSRPDLVEQNRTTICDYYARLEGSMSHLPTRRQTVVDYYSDVSNPHGIPETIDKIIAVQVFEHFTPAQAVRALKGWHDELKRERPIILSVPDMAGTLDIIERGGDVAFALRHLRGRTTEDHFNSHHAWYTKDTLVELLEFIGFHRVEVLPNFHFYPAIVVRAIRL